MSKFKVDGTPLSDLIESGGNNDTNTFEYISLGTSIKYIASSKAFENPKTTGYKYQGTDIANSIVAIYTDYTVDTTINSIPTWCTQLRIIAIGGGGGGGGGGGDPGGHKSQEKGVSGSSGGGGSVVAAYINTQSFAPPYKITIGTGGTGGAYQGEPNQGGYSGDDGNQTTVNYATNTTLLIALGGLNGIGGTDPQSNVNVTSGSGANSNAGTIASGISISYSGIGNGSNQAGDAAYNSGVTSSTIGTPTWPTEVPTISNNVGNGGLGGINADNSNGYAGSDGNDGMVRIYFIK
jgi:hypothetical protein